MKTQKFLLAFTLFFTLGIGFVSAWNGLVASPGDILNASKWNELVDKINPLYSVGGTGGSVGVGDSTPDHKLDVAGNIGLNASSYINFGDTDGSTGYGFRDNAGTIQFKNNAGSWISIPTTGGGGNDDLGNHTATQNIALDTFWLSSDGDSEGIIIDIDGNVGVGEAVPTGKLHISNTYTDTSNATIVASSSIPGINLRTTSSGRFSIFSNYNTANTTSILTSTGTSNPTNVLALFDHTTGYVGFGDTSPDHKVDIQGNLGIGTGAYLNFGDADGTSGYGIRDNAGAIEFKNNAGAWTAIPTGSGIGTLNTLTASSQTFATGSTGADFNFVSAGSVHTLNIPSAGTTARGLVTTAAQSFAGTKTFTNDFLVNGATTLGDAGADTLTINASTASIPNGLNFDTNTLFLDATNNRVGIGLGTTTAALHIKAGTATASTAPLKFTSGTNLTTAEAGAVEYNGTQLFFTPATTRNILAQISGATALTTGSIPFATTSGYLTQDNTNFFWDDTANELGIGDNTPDHTLDVNGNIGLTASSYINFGDTTGTTGYGIRDNAGAIEFKNNAGAWTAIPTGSGIGTLNTLTASSQTFATGSTGADFNFASAGSVHTLNIPSAGTTARGLVTTAAQSFAGTKTFTNDFLVNGATTLGDAGADTFTINASTASIPNGLNFDTNTLFLDATNNRVGIGLGTTTAALHIKAGTATASTAPLKFTSGTNLTTAEAGAVEYNGTQLFFTPSTTRNILAQISGATALTTGSIPFATTNGYLLQDNTNFFWDDTSNELGIGDNTPDHTLDVNGNIGLTASSYINFGDTTGTTGYGIRDNAGAIEFKNNAGAWTAIPTGSGIGTLNTLTASSQTFATGATGADFNFASAGSVHTLNIPSAGTTARGLVTTAAQSFAGTKTFTNDFLVNGATTLGDAGADTFTINASTASIPNGLNFDTNTLFLDATNNRVGIGLGTTTAALHIKAGTATASTAPLKFTSGTNLTTAEAGAVEYNGTQLFFTPSTTRNILAQISGATALTTGSIPFATTNGYLTQDNANLFWDDTNNRLGIGDVTPSNKLEITHGTANNSGLRFTDLTSTGTTATGSINGKNLTVNTSGDVILIDELRQRVILASDVINNNAVANTLADVTGLSFAVINANRYQFECKIRYTSAATTTGSRWTINGPTTSLLSYTASYSLTATTRTISNGVVYNFPAASNTGSPYTTTGNVAIIEGFITPSANGSVIVRFASEVANSAITAKAGSTCEYWNY